ncbi:hypothetical protein GGS23DRAFT_598312 [Durotheca rogersii]|uniref:uncharacterized protein n=1 Tax=Durotheca rogersii TaxID=419775 RepID=UPI002220F850|nr:uncharacterized protein GGS23DRAFT_598312 [Durotheca rogersii]KAI5861532.1 hypothetical protein GGS23DRAFT_598312 [Durotheca rogersii]
MAGSRRAAIPPSRAEALRPVFDSLCAWLNFSDETKHQVRPGILHGDHVAPCFREFRRDYLEPAAAAAAGSGAAPALAHVRCEELERFCRETGAFGLPAYAAARRPPKHGWTAVEHAARFVVRVLRRSWEEGGEWTHGRFGPPAAADDDDPDLAAESDFVQVWAVLRYRQAEWEAANLEHWDVERLYRTFADVLPRAA